MSIRPRSDEILRSVRWSFEEFVVPELEDPYAVSVGHTIVNLLRHVELRIELEPPAVHAGNEELRPLLADLAAYAEASVSRALADVPADVRRVLDETAGSATGYPGMAQLADDAVALKGALDRTLRALQAAKGELGGSEEYDALRARIREWIGRQLEREAAWIAPAFSGLRR